jgi:hypothetical protein
MFFLVARNMIHVLDYVKPISQCCPERACIKQGEPLRGGKGNGGVGGGGQYTVNLGLEWTGIRATTQRRDFQVSKGGFQEVGGGISKQQKGVSERG